MPVLYHYSHALNIAFASHHLTPLNFVLLLPGTDLLSPKAALMDQHLHYTWRDWLRVPQFYHVGAVYMCTRLMVNVSQVTRGLYFDSEILHFILVFL